jgi:hypothetical protein
LTLGRDRKSVEVFADKEVPMESVNGKT